MAAKPLVLINPVNTGTAGRKAANHAAWLAVEEFSRSGQVRAENVISLCMRTHGKQDRPYTANQKNNAIIGAFDTRTPTMIIGTKANEEASAFNRGVYAEYNQGEAAARNLYNAVVEAWGKTPVYIVANRTYHEGNLNGQHGMRLLYNVVGERKAHGTDIIKRPRLRDLHHKIGGKLLELQGKGVITHLEAQRAMAYVGEAISKYRAGEEETRLSVLVTHAIRENTNGKIADGDMGQISNLARDYGLSSSLFVKIGDKFVPSVNLGMGNLSNFTDAIILKSEKGLLNHVAGMVEFAHRALLK